MLAKRDVPGKGVDSGDDDDDDAAVGA